MQANDWSFFNRLVSSPFSRWTTVCFPWNCLSVTCWSYKVFNDLKSNFGDVYHIFCCDNKPQYFALWIAWRDKYFIQIVSRKEFLAVSSSQKKRGANNSESFEVDFIKSFIVPANCTFSSHGLRWIVKI